MSADATRAPIGAAAGLTRLPPGERKGPLLTPPVEEGPLLNAGKGSSGGGVAVPARGRAAGRRGGAGAGVEAY
ncbi:hypothetical protein F6X54_33940, partial [Micromonospora aurantiaca]